MTRTFLLTWNPKKWPWTELGVLREKLEADGSAFEPWSVGNRSDLPVGSRVFLMRLGDPPRGLVGSGWTTSIPKLTPHWDPAKRSAGAETQTVGIEFDALSEFPLLAAEELKEAPFDQLSSWTPQSSGVELPAEVSEALESIWEKQLSRPPASPTVDAYQAATYLEGSIKSIVVNRYERDSRARRHCIQHHGAICAVCRFSFAEVYGQEFAGFIHVHHLRPVSTLGPDYHLDPVADLRPVCPNCHAALHHRRVPYGIEELREILKAQASA